MVKHSFLIICMVAALAAVRALGADSMSGPYLGQDPPGQTPEVFGPGVISKADTREHCLSLSPNGDELFFTRSEGWPYTRIMYMKQQGDQWSGF